jgi:NAD-dependent SIR2 family protein deacetylase
MRRVSKGVGVDRCSDPGCARCKDNLPFEMPKHLVTAVEQQRLVIFAGAGISTEKKTVFPSSFLSEIRHELRAPENLSFPEAMSLFCEQPDGRAKLLLRIRHRLEYVRSHPELYQQATSFHRELSTIWQIEEIVTTNWDDFFERVCGATPFITDKDLAFWSQVGRKVLKLHGSIHSLGDMVVTRQDYERCYDQLTVGVLGSRLKTLLADRTVVFVGYSLSDPDLMRLLTALTKQMDGLRPTYYVVTPEPEAPVADEALKDLRRIQTDGTHFLWALKKELLKGNHNLPDERFGRLRPALARIEQAHRTLYKKRPLAKYPETMYCASYQDGLQHSIERAINLAHTGRYSHTCVVHRKFLEYDRIRKRHFQKGNYHDAAYAEGYMDGLLLLLPEDDPTRGMPLYFVFGAKYQPASFVEYTRLAKRAAKLHSRSYKRAVATAPKYKNLVMHHTPFLDTFDEDRGD